MRSRLFAVLSFLLFATAAFAASLTVNVTDPHHAAVSGARVTVFREHRAGGLLASS